MNTKFRGSTRMIASCVVAVTALVACQPRANTAGTADATDMRTRQDTATAMTVTPVTPVPVTPVPVTPAMPPMQHDTGMGATPRSAMMDSMHTHMKAMADMSGEEMLPMVPMHREMATGALARMTTERQSMNVATDPKWNAVADSVRTDLTAMPAMTAMSLKSMMPAHHDRMMRLMQSHRDVVGGMK